MSDEALMEMFQLGVKLRAAEEDASEDGEDELERQDDFDGSDEESSDTQ